MSIRNIMILSECINFQAFVIIKRTIKQRANAASNRNTIKRIQLLGCKNNESGNRVNPNNCIDVTTTDFLPKEINDEMTSSVHPVTIFVGI